MTTSTKVIHAKNGRPTKWTPHLNRDLIDFFSVEPHKEVQTVTVGKNGYKKVETKLLPNKLPYFSRFESAQGLSIGALSRWADDENVDDKFPGFLQAYKAAKELQKEFLIQNGLCGLYNATFSIFTAKNITDMRDVSEQKIEAHGVLDLAGLCDAAEKAEKDGSI